MKLIGIRRIFGLCLIGLGILIAFFLQLEPSNAYMGYQKFPLDATYFGAAFLVLIITGALMPSRISKPTDFFSLFYGLFVLLPYSVLYPIRGEVGFGAWSVAVGVLLFPLIAVKFLTRIFLLPSFPDRISERNILRLLGAVCVLGLAFAFLRPSASAGFNLDDVYERRIEGREIFVTGSLIAYLNSMIANGLSPFFSFYSGLRKRYDFFFFAIACWVGYFYLLGLKAPLAFIFIGFLIGRAARMGHLSSFTKIIFLLCFLIFGAFLVEFVMVGDSVVADYAIRRIFTVPPYLVSAYIEFIGTSSYWSFISGVSTGNPITFEVGESFLGFQGLNANTNAFLYQLASGGIIMYLLTIILVASIFLVLDSAYRNKGGAVYIFLGFSYSVLIVEQSATTALLSSGIGLLLLATTFMRVSGELKTNINRIT